MSSVREYYESNTGKFLLFGSEGAIHRELWASGVSSKAEAVHHAHELVLRELLSVCPDGRARVLDLGCGVGAAARFIAARVPAHVYGVSVSPSQVARASAWAEQRPLAGTVSFHEGDFCALPPAFAAEARDIDLAFAIESFVHASSADAFFSEASRALRVNGRLVVIDDFLVKRDAQTTHLLEDFQSGWQIHSLLAVAGASEIAARYGLAFLGATDLSSIQRLGRPRDRLIRALQPLLRLVRRHSVWAQSLVGGDALQRCHRAGLLTYSLVRFRKEGG